MLLRNQRIITRMLVQMQFSSPEVEKWGRQDALPILSMFALPNNKPTSRALKGTGSRF